MKRLTREHGRILSVETKYRGDALAEDALAGVTTLVVSDAGDFDEDGGWLTINGQVVEYTECDDEEGTITLATGLMAAAEQGDAVHLYSEFYQEAVDYQEILVELDGEYDNPETVVAELADGLPELPEGDRGKAAESCTLLRVSDDEWEIVNVGGRPKRSADMQAEAHDAYTITAADVTAGTATMTLSHTPIGESVKAFWGALPQEPTEYTISGNTITWPLDFHKAGDRLWVHYWYRVEGAASPSFYIDDDFDRAVLGSATKSDGTAIPWETARGTWEPSSGTLYATAVTSSTSVCVIDAERADGDVAMEIVGSAGSGRAFLFRVSDDLLSGFGVETNGRVSYDPSFATDGDDRTIVSLGVTFEPGDELRVRMEGENLTFYRDGIEVGSATDARNLTATKHGFGASTTGSATNGFDRFHFQGVS